MREVTILEETDRPLKKQFDECLGDQLVLKDKNERDFTTLAAKVGTPHRRPANQARLCSNVTAF